MAGRRGGGDDCDRPLSSWSRRQFGVLLGAARWFCLCSLIALAGTHGGVGRTGGGVLAMAPAGLTDDDKITLSSLFVGLNKLKAGVGLLEEIYQGTKALAMLETSPADDEEVAKEEELMEKYLQQRIGEAKTAEECFYILHTAAILHLKATEEMAVEQGVPIFWSTLRNSRALMPLFYAVKGLQTAREVLRGGDDSLSAFRGGGDAAERKRTLEDALNRLKALGSSSDGTWSKEKGGKATATSSGFAFQAVAAIVDLLGGGESLPSSSPSSAAALSAIAGYVPKLFATAESSDDGRLRFEDHENGALIATASALIGVSALLEVSSAQAVVKVSREKLAAGTNFLLSEATTPSYPSEALFLIEALDALSRNPVSVPLVISLVSSSSISFGADEKLKVAVTNPSGDKLSEMTVVLTSAARVGGGSKMQSAIVLKNKDFKEVAVDDGAASIYELAIPRDMFDLGKYEIKLTASSSPYETHYVSAELSTVMKVTGVVDVGDVKLAVLDSDTGLPSKETSLAYGTSGSAAISATHLQKLRLIFKLRSPSGKPFLPQQAFIKLLHVPTNDVHLYVAKPDGKGELLSVQLDFLEAMEKSNFLSGTYTIDLIVGDACMENPLLWTLGELELDLPNPLPKTTAPLTDGSSRLPKMATPQYGALPEIEHVFRKPEKQAPAYVAYSFCGLLLLPFLGFLFGLSKAEANLKSFPTSGFPMLSSVAFVVGILSILCVYVLFWVKWNLFTTIQVLLPLGVFTAVTGHFALSHLADARKEKVA